MREPWPIFTLTQMCHSSSMLLNLTVPLLSPWPSVLPLGLLHLSSPQNQSWAVCVPWSGGKLLSTRRAGQPWALHPSVHEPPFLSDYTLHSLICGMNDGVSMNKIWHQSWRDMEVILPLLLVYFRHVDNLWTCSFCLGALYCFKSVPLAST